MTEPSRALQPRYFWLYRSQSPCRLLKATPKPTPHGSYKMCEKIWTLPAAFLCEHVGIVNATIQNSAAYLQSWIRTLKGNKRLAITAGSQAQKAADYILNRKTQTEE